MVPAVLCVFLLLFTAVSLDQDRKSLGQQRFCHVFVHSCLDTFLSNENGDQREKKLIWIFRQISKSASLQHKTLSFSDQTAYLFGGVLDIGTQTNDGDAVGVPVWFEDARTCASLSMS